MDSLRDLLAESADATVDSVRTVLLPYLTLMARHQVQLSISPPLQGDVRTQRRLIDVLGFDQVVGVAVGELTAQLNISLEKAAAVKRLLVSVQLRLESLETLLNKPEFKRRSSASSQRTFAFGSLLEKGKESMDIQTENLRPAMNYAEQKQDIIDALVKQIKKEREVFMTTVSPNIENTRKLHDLLLKATWGTWVDADTAALIADLKDRLPAAEIDLSTLGLDQDHSSSSDKRLATRKTRFALAEALAKTAKQVQSSASKRSHHGSDDGSSDDSSEENTPIPSGQASRAGSAADAGGRLATAASSPTPSRRGFHMPKAWKNKPKSKRQKTASHSLASARSRSSLASRRSTSRSPARSPSAARAKSPASHPRSRSHSVSRRPAKSKSPASPPAAPAAPPKAEPSNDDQPPVVVDLTQDGSDEDMEEEPTAVPTEPDDAEVTRQASPTPLASLQRSNVASPPSLPSSTSAVASPWAPTSYVLEMEYGSRDDEPSFDFRSDDTAGGEDIPPPTDVSRASAAVEGSITGVPTTSSPGTSRPESSPPVIDSASSEASSRAPQASSPMSRALTSPTTPRRHHPPPGSAQSQALLLPQKAGPGQVIVATYTSRRRRGDPDRPVPLPMTHQAVRGTRPAVLPSASFHRWDRPFLDIKFLD
ncbi:hypothetical protein F444_03492 [Phytophthora nicotianae P1976]|uniref:Uncharacterized protein n=1 Tax=Phytophthora nicotianae P1976 TaxID=1317066 RepID=A0A081AU02_PHYNI|nr:hypothetical protein F444_03492 [Phytophthora nicotianae P1976]